MSAPGDQPWRTNRKGTENEPQHHHHPAQHPHLADRPRPGSRGHRRRRLALNAGSAQAAQTQSFGSDLDKTVQPSNAGTAHECNGFEGKKCTWVMNEAYGNPGGEESPKAGKLKSIKLIAGEAGSFKLQIVKTKNNGASKVVANGPTINYDGQTAQNYNTSHYNVEKFDVNVQIPAGARLAIKTKETSTLRCSSGGDNTLLHQPPLQAGAGSVSYTHLTLPTILRV